MVELATFLEPAWRGRSESASESSVGGWAWGTIPKEVLHG
jgi:hypothetical protein